MAEFAALLDMADVCGATMAVDVMDQIGAGDPEEVRRRVMEKVHAASVRWDISGNQADRVMASYGSAVDRAIHRRLTSNDD